MLFLAALVLVCNMNECVSAAATATDERTNTSINPEEIQSKEKTAPYCYGLCVWSVYDCLQMPSAKCIVMAYCVKVSFLFENVQVRFS